jgi:hypothetical protein
LRRNRTTQAPHDPRKSALLNGTATTFAGNRCRLRITLLTFLRLSLIDPRVATLTSLGTSQCQSNSNVPRARTAKGSLDVCPRCPDAETSWSRTWSANPARSSGAPSTSRHGNDRLTQTAVAHRCHRSSQVDTSKARNYPLACHAVCHANALPRGLPRAD